MGLRNAVILGSGRSGTSMLAGCFAGAGFHMGGPLLRATPSNPKGLFEARAVNDANEELMRAAGVAKWRPSGPGRHLRWLPGPGHGWLVSVAPGTPIIPTPGFPEAVRAILSRTPYCLKDPRFSYTLHCWRPYLDDTLYICVFRHPALTVASMVAEAREAPYLSDFWVTRRRVMRTWECMYRWILDVHSRDGTWMFCHYDQVLAGDALDAIEKVLGASLDRSVPERRVSRARVGTGVPPGMLAIYGELCARAGYRNGLGGG